MEAQILDSSETKVNNIYNADRIRFLTMLEGQNNCFILMDYWMPATITSS